MAWYDFPPQQGGYSDGRNSGMQYPPQPQPRNNWDQPTSQMASLGQVMQGTNRQQQQMATPSYSFPGRAVENEDDIKAGEIPMDGTLCLFPANDLSVIYAKAWNAKGTIDTVAYVPKRPEPAAPPSPDPYLQEILTRVANLEALLQQQMSFTPAQKAPPQNNGGKKGRNEDTPTQYKEAP